MKKKQNRGIIFIPLAIFIAASLIILMLIVYLIFFTPMSLVFHSEENNQEPISNKPVIQVNANK